MLLQGRACAAVTLGELRPEQAGRRCANCSTLRDPAKVTGSVGRQSEHEAWE